MVTSVGETPEGIGLERRVGELQRLVEGLQSALGVLIAVDPRPDAAPAPAGLYATLFGRFRLYRDGRRLPLAGGRAVVELGRYLIAHAGRAVPREELVELLWPDARLAPALHRLHVAVSDLRRVVNPPSPGRNLVVYEDDCYLVPAGLVVTDGDLFEDHYRRGKQLLAAGDESGAARAFEAALHLYAGDYLADQPYAEWAQRSRGHFQERRLSALNYLCEHAWERGQLADVVEYAQQILAIDSLRERAHRHLIRAQYRLGQRACAIRQFRLCAGVLRQELGAEPSELTQQLHRAVCRDEALPGES